MRTLISLFIGLTALLAISGFRSYSTVQKLMADKATSTLTYTMKHPMHTWDGVNRDVNGVMLYDESTRQIRQVAIAAKVASFNSQNANRDSHALEVLDGIKYPNVTFASQSIKADATGNLIVTGKLTFHGQTKPITVTAERRDEPGQLTVTGSFNVKLEDYKIERPSLMMMPVADPFAVKFVLVFKT